MEDFVNLSLFATERCSLWWCPKRKRQGLEFCTDAHDDLSHEESEYNATACFSTLFTHGTFMKTKLFQIYELLTAGHGVRTGIPDLSDNMHILSGPPWHQPGKVIIFYFLNSL